MSYFLTCSNVVPREISLNYDISVEDDKRVYMCSPSSILIRLRSYSKYNIQGQPNLNHYKVLRSSNNHNQVAYVDLTRAIERHYSLYKQTIMKILLGGFFWPLPSFAAVCIVSPGLQLIYYQVSGFYLPFPSILVFHCRTFEQQQVLFVIQTSQRTRRRKK